eukprot:comp20552_c0_seq1/m.26383 comp20552_c0_seq1/g.26383  ORF comp20552_c0_seq1/g.26383 comp20552_c0_seq1/m.26383 type:complete len:317 (-) comp20552_c0_seq1:83-1033(-)
MAKVSDESWYFTKEELENTPTQLKDGKSYDEEMFLRKDGATFIADVGIEMKMPQLTIATATVFFHRFYVYKSLIEYPPKDMGTVCLFLAGKVEETPKKLREIIIKAELIKSNRQNLLKEETEEFRRIKEKLLQDERVLLQTISFDLTIEHPYKYLLGFIKALKGDKNFAQTAWNFINDSLRSTVCLQYHPRVVACAVILLAARMRGFQLPDTVDGKEWFKAFVDESVTREELEAVGDQIKSLYAEEATDPKLKQLLKTAPPDNSRAPSPHQRPQDRPGQKSPLGGGPLGHRPDTPGGQKRPAEGEQHQHAKAQRTA